MKTFFASLSFVVVLAGSVSALEIRVAPRTLVLSSNGGKLTVHTDAPYYPEAQVSLWVDGVELDEVAVFHDDCGNLVAQASKAAAAAAIGDFKGKMKRVTVTLVVDGVSASGHLRVKK